MANVFLTIVGIILLAIQVNGMSMLRVRRKVAIVGAGPAGMAAAKQLNDVGVLSKVFSNTVAGMWNSDANPFWPSMKTNLSKYTCKFSDQPWPETTAMFPSQSDMHRYLSEYAAKHIPSDSFVNGCRVTRVKLTESGQYSLTWEDVQKATQSEIFDDVIITSGFFSKPIRVGNFERFNGRVMHSSEYTTPDMFAGRKVAVVGASFSSAEIAADVSSTAAVVHNVVPRPSWIIPRYLPLRPDKPNSAFVPVDLLFYQLRADRDGQDRREVLFKSDAEREKTNTYMLSLLGTASNDVLHEMRRQERAEHSADAKGYAVPSVHASISDNYSNAVRDGTVRPVHGYVHSGVGNTLYLTPTSTSSTLPTFSATTTIEDVDDVILCTGFTPDLDYLDAPLRETIGLSADPLQPLLLHRDVMHPDLPGLYFVGMYRGPYFAVVELQARAVAGYIAGTLPVPSEEVMREGVALSQQIRNQQPRPQFPHADYVGLGYDWMRELGLPLPFSDPDRALNARAVFSPSLIAADLHRAQEGEAAVEDALKACEAGKHLSETIFRALPGEWAFERTLVSRLDIAPSGTVVGTIRLLRCDTKGAGGGDLAYVEKGRFATSKGMVMDVNGSQYVYALNTAEDCIDIYFADKATGRQRERIFVSLKVVGREDDGWLAVGEPHLCGEDTYRVRFKLAFQGLALRSVLISIDVTGPYKDYSSITLLQRPST